MTLDTAAITMEFDTILYYLDNSLSIKDKKAGKRREKRKGREGTSLVAHWLRLCAPTAGGSGLIPGQGTRIPHAAGCGPQKKGREAKRKARDRFSTTAVRARPCPYCDLGHLAPEL